MATKRSAKKKMRSSGSKKKTRTPVTFTVHNADELRNALVAARSGDTVACLPGTYVPGGPSYRIPAGVHLTSMPASNVGCDHCNGSESDHETGCPVGTGPLERFRREWATLPPLVRANLASGVAERMHAIIADYDKRILFHQQRHLGRRAEVMRRFQIGGSVIAGLFMALCLEADNEAVKRGIDTDVTPDPSSQFALGT